MKQQINIATNILKLRKKKGLTQEALAEKLYVTNKTVSKWERGETLPDITLLPDLAKILETTIDFILLGNEKVIEYKGKKYGVSANMKPEIKDGAVVFKPRCSKIKLTFKRF